MDILNIILFGTLVFSSSVTILMALEGHSKPELELLDATGKMIISFNATAVSLGWLAFANIVSNGG